MYWFIKTRSKKLFEKDISVGKEVVMYVLLRRIFLSLNIFGT